MTDVKQQWGRNIRRIRELRNDSQEVFGLALGGIRQSTVARWERGEISPRDDLKVLIADLDPMHRAVHEIFPLTRNVEAAS